MSEIKVNSIKGVAASSAAISINNSDGTCTANLTNRTNKNLIINGAMQVAQRGTSSTSLGYYTIDRFYLDAQATDENPTQAQVDVASGTSPYTLGFRKAFKITNGNQTSGAGTADLIYFHQKIEAQNIANSGWNYTSTSSFITLSFWIKSSVSQTFKGHLKTDDGTAQIYHFETGSLTADTWTKITKTILGNSNLTFNNDTGTGLRVVITPFAGTDFTASSANENAWQAYSGSIFGGKDNTSTWYTTNDATLEITGVQLEVGSVATDFEHRSYADEVKLCERYFQTSFEKGQAPTHGLTKYVYRMTRPFASNIVTGMGCELRTEMRATPTTIIYTTSNGSNSTTNRVSYYDGSWTSAAISIHESLNTKSIAFDGTLSSSAVLYQFNFTCESEL